MKIFLFFMVSFSLFVKAQNFHELDEEISADITLYTIGAKKCPGALTHNNCFRTIGIISALTPKRSNLKRGKAISIISFKKVIFYL